MALQAGNRSPRTVNNIIDESYITGFVVNTAVQSFAFLTPESTNALVKQRPEVSGAFMMILVWEEHVRRGVGGSKTAKKPAKISVQDPSQVGLQHVIPRHRGVVA